jgi:hypothetical protein
MTLESAGIHRNECIPAGIWSFLQELNIIKELRVQKCIILLFISIYYLTNYISPTTISYLFIPIII